MVQERCLTQRGLCFSGGVTEIVTLLGATNTIIGVGLVGLRMEVSDRFSKFVVKVNTYDTIRVTEVLGSERHRL